ncbi:MAG: hypothetical protein JNK23_10485 [Opitutaceae bacterium]|nr:hypothetical protein [Opitutaceae bacterium]
MSALAVPRSTKAELAEAELDAYFGLADHAVMEAELWLTRHRTEPRDENMLPVCLIAAAKWVRAARTNLNLAAAMLAKIRPAKQRPAGKGLT